MKKKDTWLIAILVLLVAIYVCFFTSLFKPKTLKIGYTTRPMRYFRARRQLPDILFLLGNPSRLTEIKVVPLADFKTNPEAPPIWHLISDSNSVPMQRFAYGQRIRGMRPAIRGEEPEDLETNVTYRLFVNAGGTKGWEDFQIQ